MLSRLEARVQRLEQQRQGTDTALAPGLSGLLASARAQHSEAVPMADLADAELDATITALAGSRGLSRLLKQELRGCSHPLQGWQCELSALEDEAPLELPPGASLVKTFTFHQQIRYQT